MPKFDDKTFAQQVIARAKRIDPTCKVHMLHDCVEFETAADKAEEIANLPNKILDEMTQGKFVPLTVDPKLEIEWK